MRPPSAFFALASSLAALGCSESSPAPGSPSDASADQAALDTSVEPAPSPHYDGGTEAFCEALAAYYNRCDLPSECHAQKVRDWCAALSAEWSASCRADVLASLKEGPCYTRENFHCNASGPPSAAQTRVASAYCAQCSDAGGCVDDFFRARDPAYPGAGAVVLGIADGLATPLIDACLTDAGAGGCSALRGCAIMFVNGAAPPLPPACPQ